jgi:hypothetical protein
LLWSRKPAALLKNIKITNCLVTKTRLKTYGNSLKMFFSIIHRGNSPDLIIKRLKNKKIKISDLDAYANRRTSPDNRERTACTDI